MGGPILVGLQGIPQTYAWGVKGSKSLVASSVKQTDHFTDINESTPYAELWFGCHPSAPSMVLLPDGSKESIEDWLKNQQLPYLFKILAIEQPLSLQLHPDEESAARLNAEDPQHYTDSHSKPEAAFALSDPCEVLCGFRKLREIIMLAHSIPAFGKIVQVHEDEQTMLGDMMKSLYSLDESEVENLIKEVLEMDPETSQVVKKEPSVLGSAFRSLKSIFRDETDPSETLRSCLLLFRRLHELYPSDRGLFASFFLNYIKLKPGEAISLAPNTIHAYISGNMLEVMKTSDNVVRAGLTPKFTDVKRLLELVTYRSLSSCFLKPHEVSGKFEGSGKFGVKAFIPQITDTFRFYTISVCGGGFLKDARIPDWAPMMVFVLRGSCEIIANEQEARKLVAGQACLLAQGATLGIRNHCIGKRSSNSFLISDFQSVSNDSDCHVVVVTSNLDSSKVKRSSKHSAKALHKPLSNSPPSVTEFPIVTPLENADYDAEVPPQLIKDEAVAEITATPPPDASNSPSTPRCASREVTQDKHSMYTHTSEDEVTAELVDRPCMQSETEPRTSLMETGGQSTHVEPYTLPSEAEPHPPKNKSSIPDSDISNVEPHISTDGQWTSVDPSKIESIALLPTSNKELDKSQELDESKEIATVKELDTPKVEPITAKDEGSYAVSNNLEASHQEAQPVPEQNALISADFGSEYAESAMSEKLLSDDAQSALSRDIDVNTVESPAGASTAAEDALEVKTKPTMKRQTVDIDV